MKRSGRSRVLRACAFAVALALSSPGLAHACGDCGTSRRSWFDGPWGLGLGLSLAPEMDLARSSDGVFFVPRFVLPIGVEALVFIGPFYGTAGLGLGLVWAGQDVGASTLRGITGPDTRLMFPQFSGEVGLTVFSSVTHRGSSISRHLAVTFGVRGAARMHPFASEWMMSPWAGSAAFSVGLNCLGRAPGRSVRVALHVWPFGGDALYLGTAVTWFWGAPTYLNE